MIGRTDLASKQDQPYAALSTAPTSVSPGQSHGWLAASPGKRLLVVATGLILLVGGALGLMVWQLRQDALSEARQNLSVLGLAIAEQTSRSMEAGQIVLEDLQRTIAERGPTNVQEFKERVAGESLFNFLKDRADFLPQVDAFTIIAADGKLVNYSRQWPPPPTDLSDRDYVAYFRTHDTTNTFVSSPVQNRGTGMWTAYIVRRVNSPSGEFMGMVLAALDLTYFRDFFRAVTERAGTTVTLLRSDGTALVSYPLTATIGDVLPAASHWHPIVASGQAEVFETSGVLAPGDRIVSVHPLAHYPLVINVSMAKRAVLMDWARISAVTAACALVATIGLLLLMRAYFRQYGKLEQSEGILRTQAGELSASRSVMAEQSATLEAALQHMNQGILMAAADGRVVVCNEKAAAMLELPASLLAQKPMFDALVAYQSEQGEFIDPSSMVRAGSFQLALTGATLYERIRPNGTVLEVQTVLMREGGLVRTYTDITERRRSQQQVHFLAHHDPLTGLFNRNAFHTRIAALIDDLSPEGQSFAIYCIDLDGFKHVNDTHGHPVGDQLLTAVAARLRTAVRDRDLVARMGGDEFSIVQPFTGGAHNVAELAGRLLLSVSKPFQIGDIQCSVGMSIGVALYPDHAGNIEALLQNADLALYAAKADGKGIYRLFDPAMSPELQSDHQLRQDLKLALAHGELHLEYQPIVEAERLSVVRFEALIRWTHPEHGPVSPATFVPLAEQTGLIVSIGLWVLETACAAATRWPAGVGVSVNLSPIQFAGGDLPQQVEQVLLRTGVPARQLHLEITEGVLLENTTHVHDAMERLRHLGIRFSLDDFGTAHAGLTYLRRFPFDVLKIDKSFVQEAARSQQAEALLAAMRALGAACDLDVVAEGVETLRELEIVRDLRCTHIQGYLTGKPGVAAIMEPQYGLETLNGEAAQT